MQSRTYSQQITMPERISEAAGILAAGIMRAKRRQARGIRSFSEKRLDSSANSSVHSSNSSARGEKL